VDVRDRHRGLTRRLDPETSAPPPLSLQLPADSQLRNVDRAAAEQYVLVISESRVDRDEQDLSYYDDDDDDDLVSVLKGCRTACPR
jgi:hypothetical protein